MAYLIVVWGVLVDGWIACAVMRMLVRMTVFKTSGVPTLGHAGARALATRGHAPPVQR